MFMQLKAMGKGGRVWIQASIHSTKSAEKSRKLTKKAYDVIMR